MTSDPIAAEQIIEKSAEGLISRLCGPAVQGFGEILGDRVRYMRYRNLHSIRRKMEQDAEKRGIEVKLKVLPMAVGLPLIEAASLEEDETIQQLWARLLLNCADASGDKGISKALVQIVASLEPIDARVLDFLDRQGWLLYGNVSGGFDCDRIAKEINVAPNDVAISLSNLWRLGCLIQQVGGSNRIDVDLHSAGPTRVPGIAYLPSPLGHQLLEAVQESPGVTEGNKT